MDSSSWFIAASAPFSGTLSAQIILHTIKLQLPPTYKGEIDNKIFEAWIYSVKNYLAVTSLTVHSFTFYGL